MTAACCCWAICLANAKILHHDTHCMRWSRCLSITQRCVICRKSFFQMQCEHHADHHLPGWGSFHTRSAKKKIMLLAASRRRKHVWDSKIKELSAIVSSFFLPTDQLLTLAHKFGKKHTWREQDKSSPTLSRHCHKAEQRQSPTYAGTALLVKPSPCISGREHVFVFTQRQPQGGWKQNSGSYQPLQAQFCLCLEGRTIIFLSMVDVHPDDVEWIAMLESDHTQWWEFEAQVKWESRDESGNIACSENM